MLALFTIVVSVSSITEQDDDVDDVGVVVLGARRTRNRIGIKPLSPASSVALLDQLPCSPCFTVVVSVSSRTELGDDVDDVVVVLGARRT